MSIDFDDPRYPEYEEEFEKIVSSKSIIPLKIVFFIDAWHFRLACRQLTIQKKKIEIENSRRDGLFFDPKKLNIDVELSATGHMLRDYFGIEITNRMVNLTSKHLKRNLLPIPKMELKIYPNQFKKLCSDIRECDGLVNTLTVMKVFAGRPPNPQSLRRQFKRALNSNRYEEGSAGYSLLIENIELSSEGKMKTVFERNPISFSDYDDFLTDLVKYGEEEERKSHSLTYAITRIDVADAGTVSIREKGVDAHLMLSLLDELEESETSAICLISNDSDYYPIIDRAKKTSSKPFFLGSLVPNQYISSSLRRSVGDEWIVSVNSMKELKEISWHNSVEWLEEIYGDL